MWNIEGLTLNKTTDNHFLQLISNHHILSLVETRTDKDGPSVNLPGFEMISMCSRKKHKKARRNSGGICIYAKCSIIKGIKCLKNKHNGILWVKLDQGFFNLDDKDIFLAVVYISPS
jgi:hypothetical protein